MDTRGDDRPGAPACRMRTDRHNFHGHRAGYRNDGSLSGQKTVPCKRAGGIAFFCGSGRAFSAALLRAKRPRFPICQPAFEPDTPVGGKPAFSPRTYLRQSRTSVGKKQKNDAGTRKPYGRLCCRMGKNNRQTCRRDTADKTPGRCIICRLTRYSVVLIQANTGTCEIILM